VLFGAVVEAPPVPVVLPFEDEPGEEPLAAEPPEVELAPAVAPPACASAKVLESANAVANATVVIFMGRFLGYWPRISLHERLMFQISRRESLHHVRYVVASPPKQFRMSPTAFC
jgi:hypothetical protein